MIYTVCFDLFLDDDDVLSEKEITEVIKEMADSSAVSAYNVKLLDVND